MLKCQQHLDEAHDPSGRPCVAHIRLYRADGTTALGAGSESSHQTLDLDGVAQARSRTVGFDIGDRRWINLGPTVDFPYQVGLGPTAGGREAIAATVLVGARGSDDTVDVVPVAQCRFEGPQHHGAHGLSRHKAIRGIIERATLPGRREHPETTGHIMKARRGGHENTTCQSQLTLTILNALTGQVQSHQRRGASRINRHGRPAQVEQIREPRRQDRDTIPKESVGFRLALLGQQGVEVVACSHADEDAAFLLVEPAVRVTRVFQGVPGRLQEQALLWVHELRFGTGDLEEQRIEAIDVIEEAPPTLQGLFFGFPGSGS